ncbi:solute carrier family 4 member 11-like [Mytilus trossulus]|uniref:solute carrier family 4 member 11-like n=1 Tax=Mytilus trossulus TaxID=6551 RepID=UPI0030046121
MDSSPEETTVELEQVFIVTPTSERTPDIQSESSASSPPNTHNGIEKSGHLYFSKINPKVLDLKQNGRLYLSPSDNSVDSVGHYRKGGYLSPLDTTSDDEGGGRRRHKSEGSVQVAPVRPNHLIPNKKNSMYESRSTISGVRFDDPFIDENGHTLMYSRHEKVPLKDFSMEYRASKDIKKFLDNFALILDLNKNGVDEIIDDIVKKILEMNEAKAVFDESKLEKITLDQVRSALFTHDQVHMLSRTLQCTSISVGGGFDYDQNWICAMASIPSIQTRHIGIARLKYPANLGISSEEVYFVIVVLTPIKEKGTKNELETGRTFATLFSDVYFRLQLLGANTEEEFKKLLEDQTKELADRQRMSHTAHKIPILANEKPSDTRKCNCRLFQGIKEDLNRRLPHYISDYTDGFTGNKTIQKTISTTLFLYFACLMPSIAFGVLNNENTNGALNVQKVLYSQVFGGLFFAVFGGTPQIILLTTAPLALFTKIIYSICEDFSLEFMPMFTCVGLWNSFFLFLYSSFGLSKLMQWSTRSSEEIFALFISIAFIVDALKNTAQNFANHYNIPACNNSSSITTNTSVNVTTTIITVCERDVSLCYLILLLGTLWLGVTLYNFTKTPYLNAGKRELLADYSLPVSVIIMSVFGALAFKDVTLIKSFQAGPLRSDMFQLMPFYSLPVGAVFGAMGLGFCLSLLFFMDQNITAALVNGPQNKMKKGTAYHWDLLVIGVINVVLSLLGFPWVHAALPHSPLHVQALADVEERVDQGHIYKILVSVRETRITAIFSHILIGLSLLITPVLSYIPTPVLYGLFLYVGITSLYGNQMFERIMLLFTEQNAYPPNHYIRRVPQRMMHLFTVLQLLQLLVLCGLGFAPYPYLKMFFPVLIFLLIPLRHKVIPHLVDQRYLKAMDSH